MAGTFEDISISVQTRTNTEEVYDNTYYSLQVRNPQEFSPSMDGPDVNQVPFWPSVLLEPEPVLMVPVQGPPPPAPRLLPAGLQNQEPEGSLPSTHLLKSEQGQSSAPSSEASQLQPENGSSSSSILSVIRKSLTRSITNGNVGRSNPGQSPVTGRRSLSVKCRGRRRVLNDGCLRRSIQHETVTERPSEVRTTLSPSHKQRCTAQEVADAQCLHGGSCFAVPVQGGRTTGCSCPQEWSGDRCHLRYIDPNLLAVRDQHMRTANIAAGVSVCILVVFVVLLAVYVYLRFRRKQRILKDHEFDASAEELYRRPFSGRSSIVESISRANSIRKGGTYDEKELEHCPETYRSVNEKSSLPEDAECSGMQLPPKDNVVAL